MSTERKPVRWVTYQGDCRGNRGLVVGPNTLGEILHVVTEDYEPITATTRVGFAYGMPAEPSEWAKGRAEHTRVAVFFGGRAVSS